MLQILKSKKGRVSMSLLSFLVIVFNIFVFIGMQASIYRQLAEGI
jgi:hypothetical protein